MYIGNKKYYFNWSHWLIFHFFKVLKKLFCEIVFKKLIELSKWKQLNSKMCFSFFSFISSEKILLFAFNLILLIYKFLSFLILTKIYKRAYSFQKSTDPSVITIIFQRVFIYKFCKWLSFVNNIIYILFNRKKSRINEYEFRKSYCNY